MSLGGMLHVMLCGRIYALMVLTVAKMYAGHLQRKCSADSSSPQLVQRGLFKMPIVCRCLFRLWPVRIPVILLRFFLLRERKNLEFFALMFLDSSWTVWRGLSCSSAF